MGRRLPSCLLLSVVLVASPRVLEARSIAVIPFAGSGSVDEEDLFQAGEVVGATLRERGHDVLGPVEAAERIDARVPGCIASGQRRCWTRAATLMARDAVVHGTVRRDAVTGETAVTLSAIGARDGRVLAESFHRGTAPTRAFLVALVRTAAAHLSDELPALQRHPRLRVETEPSGAELIVNGSPVGRSPWSAEMSSGTSVVEARLSGRGGTTRRVDLVEGENRTLTILLLGAGDGAVETSRRASWQMPLGVVSVVLGAAGIGVGLFELLRPACPDAGSDGACGSGITTGERVGLGVVPLVLGLAAATAGVLVAFVLELEDVD